MTKPLYTRQTVEPEDTFRWIDGRYKLVDRGYYYRHPKTQKERREIEGFILDGLPVRRKRRLIPDSRNMRPPARQWGRSWKDYTKRRKQWEDR